MEIKVLGPGCVRCKETEKVVREAVAESGVAATVGKVTDMQQIVSYGLFTTPGVVIDGVVKVSGKVPTKAEMLALLKA
ncbi:MAG: thioredoxin family protein [Desulfovibrionaceae bacterium]